MQKVKKILMGFIVSVLSFIFLYNIYNLINLKLLHKNLTTVFGYGLLEVVSGSMEPTLEVGDVILINTNVKEFKVDDIVTFYDSESSFVTHRILSINNETFTTKGDNNNTMDKEMSIDNIVGLYVGRLKGMGILVESLKSPFTLVMIFIIGVLVCMLISTDDENTKNTIIEQGNKTDEEPKLELNLEEVVDDKKDGTKEEPSTIIVEKKSNESKPKDKEDDSKVAKTKSSTKSKPKTTTSKTTTSKTSKKTTTTASKTSSKKTSSSNTVKTKVAEEKTTTTKKNTAVPKSAKKEAEVSDSKVKKTKSSNTTKNKTSSKTATTKENKVSKTGSKKRVDNEEK